MNHLAHLFLSQSNVDLMVGNFIADHVKGKQLFTFSEEIQRGIRMHRAIDSFTDQHRIVLKSKERLYATYHKYAAVIIDMFYDHILAKNWKNYSPIPLRDFTSSCYKVLDSKQTIYPKSAQRFLFYMSKNDWLFQYSTLSGIGQALNGLSKRAKFESKMEKSIIDLEKDFDAYENEFELFFPELFEYSQLWMKENT